MGAVSRRKSIHYKRAEMKVSGITLQTYVETAIKKKKKPGSRMELLDEEGTTKRFINSHEKIAGMLFGQLMLYEAGKHQSILVLDDDKDEYPVEAIAARPNDDGKRREFIESVLYFGILENHMVLVQSKSLRARQFESHLNWFLWKCTKTMSKEQSIFISDKPTESARKKIEESPVKSVVIGTPLETDRMSDKEMKLLAPKTKTVRFRPVGKGFDILEAAFGGNWRDKLKLQDSLDDANLMVNLEVTYFRKTTENAHKILDNIATSLRHSEIGDVRVKLENGAELRGDDLKCVGHIDVDTYNGIIDRTSLYQGMFAWLQNQIMNNVVN